MLSWLSEAEKRSWKSFWKFFSFIFFCNITNYGCANFHATSIFLPGFMHREVGWGGGVGGDVVALCAWSDKNASGHIALIKHGLYFKKQIFFINKYRLKQFCGSSLKPGNCLAKDFLTHFAVVISIQYFSERCGYKVN